MQQPEVTAASAIVVLAAPVGFGALLGLVLRRLRGRRFRSVVAALGCLLVPAIAVCGLGLRFPIVGVWDTAFEAVLVGIGTLWTAHRAFEGGAETLLAVAAATASLVLLEIGCRLLLPPPPAFPTSEGVHFFLADAMRVESRLQHWDSLSKDIVCTIAYDGYPGMFDPNMQRDIVVPRRFTPRPDAVRRVLHVGDSMAYGFGTPRDQTFVADLERFEPTVQHVNGSVPGIAPDAYYMLIRRWIASQHFDLVVMYVYEENDLDGLDSGYPCCGWQALLTYEEGRARPRCAAPSKVDLGAAGWRWLRDQSPPPYLVRVLIGWSSAAAYIGAALNAEPYFLTAQSTAQRLVHLESILRVTRDELKARNVPFLVVVLPGRRWAEDPVRVESHAPAIMALAQRLGIPALDASTVVREAVQNGARIYMPNPENNDIHYNTTGHQVIANWLRGRYEQAVALPPVS
jgi:lysophospholipase L1-like esterase